MHQKHDAPEHVPQDCVVGLRQRPPDAEVAVVPRVEQERRRAPEITIQRQTAYFLRCGYCPPPQKKKQTNKTSNPSLHTRRLAPG
jgi:hypothetical protein